MNKAIDANLRDLVAQLCLITGSFTLSTGERSNFYFDCKRATLDGQALSLIADTFIKKIDALKSNPVAIGGLTMGADFITAAVILKSFEQGKPVVKGSIVRKERKKHGTMNHVENEQPKGTEIVVIDDVITSGASTAIACDEFIKEGYRIVGILALIDREAGGTENLASKYNVPVDAVFKKSDFPELNDNFGMQNERMAIGA